MKGKWLERRSLFAGAAGVLLVAAVMTGCSTNSTGSGNQNQQGTNAQGETPPAQPLTLADIENKAKEEGSVVSVGMPDSWANWVGTWKDMETKYSLKHTDTDMSSSEEIAKFEAEKNNPTADIGDVGIAFGPVAVAKGVTQPYKTSYWDEIPEWAKDKDGHWIVGYQGAISVLANKQLVKNPPKSWDDIKNGDYKIAIGDVTKAAQSQMSVLAAAIAHGGDETNIQPGIDFFADLAKQGRLSLGEMNMATIEKGEVTVALLWDFNALSYRDQIDPTRFDVNIPGGGTVVSGYATIINKYAPHPHAAMLTREYILSDAGQINLAKGYARPIRESVKLPEDVAKKMIPADQYKDAKPVKDQKAWEETAKKLPQMWEEQVLIHAK
ncbi:ABC transporter substrate-binding protein [Brevibacillus choshinensis]|uniref:ABC transporter substrate-binding protein n=1 Tax=Brevibacillus choshinensis TaxID=54911 RepID=A0ABR5N5N6_BRECH|nr:ABC transporter substrate-binding protein [Brevibacillus choshinensis]KQL45924.1 ABC transporter substrate-binding protein [Brevibacillus choshinensis]